MGGPQTSSVASNLERTFPALRDKRLENKSTLGLESVMPVVSDNINKRFKSAPGAAASTEGYSTCYENPKTSKSFGRRSYSTPDTTSTHNQLPGGRDVSVKLSDQHNIDIKPKCTKEEVERKRLDAFKKREIERKRQEAIKKRQLNSQKNSSNLH